MINIYDLNGKVLFTGNESNAFTGIQVGGYEAGMYFVKVQYANGSTKVQKFIKTAN